MKIEKLQKELTQLCIGLCVLGGLTLFGAAFLRHKLYMPQAGDPITPFMYQTLLDILITVYKMLLPLLAVAFLVCAGWVIKCKRLLKE